MSMTGKQLGGRIGGYRMHATHTKEELRGFARRGIQATIARAIDPAGTLERDQPAEFARRYEAQLKAHMTSMSLKAKEGRETPRNKRLSVLAWACPDCNAELGLTIPAGYKRERCLPHSVIATGNAIDSVLGVTLEQALAHIAV